MPFFFFFLFCMLAFRDLKEHENTVCPGSEEEDYGPGEECITRIRRVRTFLREDGCLKVGMNRKMDWKVKISAHIRKKTMGQM